MVKIREGKIWERQNSGSQNPGSENLGGQNPGSQNLGNHNPVEDFRNGTNRQTDYIFIPSPDQLCVPVGVILWPSLQGSNLYSQSLLVLKVAADSAGAYFLAM